jgi:glycosyltransferase involved in cell wall biosynthesis
MNNETYKPLRVLQVIHALGMGGAETWLMEVLRLWSKTREVQMDFLATSGNRGTFDDEALALGARIYYVPYGKKHLVSFAKRFRHILVSGKYDAIHDHQDYSSGWHFLMGGNHLPPVRVTHVHNSIAHITVNYEVGPVRRMTAFIGRRLVDRFASNICGTSATILREYGFAPGTTQRPVVSVAHCGFSVNRFNQLPEPDRQSVRAEFSWPGDAKVVLFAGRLDQTMEYHSPNNNKNSWLALNVVKSAAAQDLRICLVMAGAGDEMRGLLERAIREWGLQDRLRLVGVRSDIDRLMRASDVLLFPSRQEGLGMVAVEAQAAGLPVLASQAVPRECIVLPEMCSFLPLECPPEEWASVLLSIVGQPRTPVEICRQALLASPFSIQFSAATLVSIYSGKNPLSPSDSINWIL